MQLKCFLLSTHTNLEIKITNIKKKKTIEIHLKLVCVLDSYSGLILLDFFTIMEGVSQQIFISLLITSWSFFISEVF